MGKIIGWVVNSWSMPAVPERRCLPRCRSRIFGKQEQLLKKYLIINFLYLLEKLLGNQDLKDWWIAIKINSIENARHLHWLRISYKESYKNSYRNSYRIHNIHIGKSMLWEFLYSHFPISIIYDNHIRILINSYQIQSYQNPSKKYAMKIESIPTFLSNSWFLHIKLEINEFC